MEKANKKVAVSIIVVLAVGVTAVVFWVMYSKTNALYRRIVEQYRQYEAKESRLKEQHRSGSGAEGLEESKERALFDRIEQLMSGEKTYRQKDVSLNMLAEMLHSNRAYVSKVINRLAEQTFSAYINSKRIAEAVTVLSDPKDDTHLWKSLRYPYSRSGGSCQELQHQCDGQHRFLICLRGNTRGREHDLFHTGGGKGVFRQFQQF